MVKKKVKGAKPDEKIKTQKVKKEYYWNIPQPKGMSQYIWFWQRWMFKLRTAPIVRRTPILNKWALQTPLYYCVIFFPNQHVNIVAVPQQWNGTIKLKTRTMQINPKKVWHFLGDAILFFNYDCAEPLSVDKAKMKFKDLNPVLYKQNLENTHLSQLLKPQEPAINNKILLYAMIGLGIILLVILANSAGWIDLSGLVQK